MGDPGSVPGRCNYILIFDLAGAVDRAIGFIIEMLLPDGRAKYWRFSGD